MVISQRWTTFSVQNPSSNHRTNHKNHYPSDNNHHCLHVSFLEHGAYAAGSSLN